MRKIVALQTVAQIVVLQIIELSKKINDAKEKKKELEDVSSEGSDS